MNRTRVLVISDGAGLGAWLARRLGPAGFRVRIAVPDAGLVDAVREDADIAVLDGIDVHRESAPLAVALLKDRNPAIRIIALSDAPSELDGAVVEQGLFCYLGSCSRAELLRVIEAAAGEKAQPGRRPTVSEPRSLP